MRYLIALIYVMFVFSCKSQELIPLKEISNTKEGYMFSNIYEENIFFSKIKEYQISIITLSNPKGTLAKDFKGTGETILTYVITVSLDGEYCNECFKVFEFDSNTWYPKENFSLEVKKNTISFTAKPENTYFKNLKLDLDIPNLN